jgi:hypothetical protein
MMSRLLLVAALLLVHGELRAEPSEAEKRGMPPTLAIYNAKGPADSCGPGCDRWIAVEGQIDEEAAPRIRRFLSGVKDTRRPIYLHSPGGKVGQSYAIGRLLRSRKAVARVGRTVVKACAGGSQADAACLKLKTAGGEVEAELTTRSAMCNSACGYILISAVTREVAPDTMVGVHNSKFLMVVHGHPSARLIEQFRERGMEKANRERAAFIASMGISSELDDLIRTVKYESVHVLTRAELYRFGIDTRSTIDGAWASESWSRPSIFKSALVRKADGSDFRRVGWRLTCGRGDSVRLTYLAQIDRNAARTGSVGLLLASEKRLAFDNPTRTTDYEFWNVTMAPDALNTLFSMPHAQIEENALLPDGTAARSTVELDATGLEDAWKKVSASCGTGAPVGIPRASGLPAFMTSPAARVTTTRPEPGSVWPGVTTLPPSAAATPEP